MDKSAIAFLFLCLILVSVRGQNSFASSFSRHSDWNSRGHGGYRQIGDHVKNNFDGDFVFPASDQFVFPNANEDSSGGEGTNWFQKTEPKHKDSKKRKLRKSDKSKYERSTMNYTYRTNTYFL